MSSISGGKRSRSSSLDRAASSSSNRNEESIMACARGPKLRQGARKGKKERKKRKSGTVRPTDDTETSFRASKVDALPQTTKDLMQNLNFFDEKERLDVERDLGRFSPSSREIYVEIFKEIPDCCREFDCGGHQDESRSSKVACVPASTSYSSKSVNKQSRVYSQRSLRPHVGGRPFYGM